MGGEREILENLPETIGTVHIASGSLIALVYYSIAIALLCFVRCNTTQKITDVERIFVIGEGRSGLAIRMAAMRLVHLGCQVYVVGETTTPSIRATDLFIACSGSGSTETVCAIAAKAKANRSIPCRSNGRQLRGCVAKSDRLANAGDRQSTTFTASINPKHPFKWRHFQCTKALAKLSSLANFLSVCDSL